jgi:hypothetical protein
MRALQGVPEQLVQCMHSVKYLLHLSLAAHAQRSAQLAQAWQQDVTLQNFASVTVLCPTVLSILLTQIVVLVCYCADLAHPLKRLLQQQYRSQYMVSMYVPPGRGAMCSIKQSLHL